MTEPDQPTVNDGFKLLAKNTELSLGEYTAITQSQADIELFLMQRISTFSTVLYGAFARKTIVSPLAGSIVNMLVVYREDDISFSFPSRIFQQLSDILIEQYPDAYVIDGRSILMLPIDNFFYKIQPAYSLSGHTYMLPAEKFDEWVKYDVTLYNEILSKENVKHKGKLIEIVRMVKTWNRSSGNLFNGYYLELLVTDLLSSYEITSYSETLCYIFKSAIAKVAYQQQDPANIEFEIDSMNDLQKVVNAMVVLKNSYKLAHEALKFEQEDNIEQALKNWNKLLPQAFPTQVDMMVSKARNAGIKGADALRMMINNK